MEKSLGKQVLYSIITIGLYLISWFYSTGKQLDRGTDASCTPILAIIPLVNILLMWQVSSAAEAVTDQDDGLIFLLFLLFAPVSWYWVQTGINEAAGS